jgi:hypothetical protein
MIINSDPILRPPGDLTDAVIKLQPIRTIEAINICLSMQLSDKKNSLVKTMKYSGILHGPDDEIIGTVKCNVSNGSAEMTAHVEFPKITWVDKLKEWATPILLLAILLKKSSLGTSGM